MKSATLSIVFLALFASAGFGASLTDSLKPGRADLKSAGVLAFGPEGILFVGDSRNGAVFALDTEDQTPGPGSPVSMKRVDEKIAALLGTTPGQIQISDIAVNPVSKKTYVSVSRGRGAGAVPAIVRIDETGKLEALPLDNIRFSRAILASASAGTAANQRLQTITDLAFVNNTVYVAGLTNEEFSSNMNTIPFPFGDVGIGSSVEIFHGSHGQFETNAPVRTFVPYRIGNEDYLLAAYACTPLVKIPVSSLKAGEQVEGTTIAEMGLGNRPLDMIVYAKGGKNFILMATSSRGVARMSADGLDQYPAITNGVTGRAGVPYESLQGMNNVLQLSAVDDQRAVVLERIAGSLNLRTIALP